MRVAAAAVILGTVHTELMAPSCLVLPLQHLRSQSCDLLDWWLRLKPLYNRVNHTLAKSRCETTRHEAGQACRWSLGRGRFFRSRAVPPDITRPLDQNRLKHPEAMRLCLSASNVLTGRDMSQQFQRPRLRQSKGQLHADSRPCFATVDLALSAQPKY